jgi:hypothetical protein
VQIANWGAAKAWRGLGASIFAAMAARRVMRQQGIRKRVGRVPAARRNHQEVFAQPTGVAESNLQFSLCNFHFSIPSPRIFPLPKKTAGAKPYGPLGTGVFLIGGSEAGPPSFSRRSDYWLSESSSPCWLMTCGT